MARVRKLIKLLLNTVPLFSMTIRIRKTAQRIWKWIKRVFYLFSRKRSAAGYKRASKKKTLVSNALGTGFSGKALSSRVSSDDDEEDLEDADRNLSKRNEQTPPLEPDLPYSYNVTKLVLMVRDPHYIFCYWDFSEETWEWIQSFYREREEDVRAVLRLYDVTDIRFDGSNAHSLRDLGISLTAKRWYVDVDESGREWILELGFVDARGEYHLIVRGNRVRTPRDGPSTVVDAKWKTKDFEKVYAVSGGFGVGLSSAELRKIITERSLTERDLFSRPFERFPRREDETESGDRGQSGSRQAP